MNEFNFLSKKLNKMSAKTNLQGEINRLDDLIQQKKAELERLETIVIKITEPQEISLAKRRKIDRLIKQMELFSTTLASYGLSPKTRVESLTTFLEELFKQSQNLKAKRDRYANMIPIAEKNCADMKQAVMDQRTQIINDYQNQLQKFKEICDLFNSLKSILESFNPNYVIPLKDYCHNWPYSKDGVYEQYKKLNLGIDNTKKSLDIEKDDYEQQIAQLQEEIEKIKKQIAQYKKKEEESQKAYDESFKKAKDCLKIKRMLEKYIAKEEEFRAKTSKYCASINFQQSDEILLQQIKKIDEFNEKINKIHASFAIISNKLEAETNEMHSHYTVKFKALKTYSKIRKEINANQQISSQELPLYVMNPTQLKKRYETSKAAYDNSESNFNARKERAKKMLKDAQIRYEEASKNIK